jgi:hypothetical protein
MLRRASRQRLLPDGAPLDRFAGSVAVEAWPNLPEAIGDCFVEIVAETDKLSTTSGESLTAGIDERIRHAILGQGPRIGPTFAISLQRETTPYVVDYATHAAFVQSNLCGNLGR